MKPCEGCGASPSVCARCQMPNDRFRFEEAMLKQKGRGEPIALICYDIMSLRKINHAYGRRAGDSILSAVADFVAATTLETVYRIEGDLYCVTVPSARLSEAVRLARILERRFDLPWDLQLEGREVALFISLTLAIVEVPCGYEGSYPDLLERALELSRKSKTITIFDRETERISREHIRLQMDLRNCILRNMTGFDVFFQPIADPISGKWVAAEALCRWERPGHGSVSPFTFIREAEEMGYIHNIGAWVLETAVKHCKDLGLHCLDSFFVSVNVSALQIIRHDFAQTVLDIVRCHDYPCDKLLLEITESNEFAINDSTRGTIDLLREYGVMFALDDFGTGYSGFNSLKHMPVNYLKSERDFIHNIEQDTYLQYFLFVLSQVAHSNGMRLIAEGVEAKEQLDCVVRNGADLIQGYYFGKPMCRAELGAALHHFYHPSEKMRYTPRDYVDFSRWINSREAYTITPSLFALMMRCIDILLNADTPEDSLNRILETVGAHFKVKRAYVFLGDGGTVFDNAFEWCAEGAPSHMKLLQGVEGTLDGFYDTLVKNRVFITTAGSQLPGNLLERLSAAGLEGSIQSMVVMPLRKKDEVIGFVGFDDDRPRQWTPEEMILLYNLCFLVLVVLGRHDSPASQDTQETA